MEQQTQQVEVKPVDKAKVKNFIKVMLYLAAITAVEFAIAFTVPHEQKWVRIVVFIVLTIVKAYYIVAEFMHLGHEKKSLKMSIVLPMLFVVFFIFIMIYQGGAILEALTQELRKKAITRLVFLVVFMIPVAWYLFLQTFGSNSFSLDKVGDVPESCEKYDEITILSKRDSLDLVETNYMNRVVFGADKRQANLVQSSQEYFDCINQSESDLVLINRDGVWGGYSLNREDVDRLLTELDILKIQESYGKGTNR